MGQEEIEIDIDSLWVQFQVSFKVLKCSAEVLLLHIDLGHEVQCGLMLIVPIENFEGILLGFSIVLQAVITVRNLDQVA